ncbi:MAG: hypothetical protein LAP13_03745 [Acidobacteriia bacterium]|nr:hypothetical protein [Terriglobia bacterium]
MNSSAGTPETPTHISTGKYKDVDAVIVESEALRLAVVPDSGAKIASLIHKKTGRECLFQAPGERFRRGAYAAPFESAEVTGFDEMFPTITECLCDVEPWAGARMPDHGEVWSLPWKCEITGSEVRASVHGVRFPYVLTRTLSFARPNTVLLRYRTENPSACDFPAMWAAHPLFNMTPGTRIIVPQSARHIMNTEPGPALGGYGGRFDFPNARTEDGREWDLSRIGPRERKLYFKYFFLDALEEGFTILHDPSTRETVALVWAIEQVPYLGMWINEGGWEDWFHVAPEPCTAPFDRWDVARQWGRLPVIPAFGSQEWEMRITVGLIENPQRVDLDGTIR